MIPSQVSLSLAQFGIAGRVLPLNRGQFEPLRTGFNPVTDVPLWVSLCWQDANCCGFVDGEVIVMLTWFGLGLTDPEPKGVLVNAQVAGDVSHHAAGRADHCDPSGSIMARLRGC
ncbi:hypothetical protein DN069_20865 [Streptacidiphilus pinicola]|uniref:Uncharacterized protein n=1 Tax=Streptacidiphilus pinicola TaxID=2219663 RepID=A0A2X0J890_9ACTN|nr:hypothetical protein DN069_20865 [Streptacidiphilus pinicola]